MPGVVAAAARRSPPLEERILAEFAAVSGTVYGLYLARLDTLTLVSGDASVWADLSGTGNDLSQGTAGERPPYGAAAVGGGPGLIIDGTSMFSAALDFSGDVAYGITLVGLCDSGITSSRVAAAIGSIGSDDGMELRLNDGADEADAFLDSGSPRTQANSLTADPSTAAVWTATADTSLSADEAEIRRNGTNITGSRPNNDDTGGLGSALKIGFGARDDGTPFGMKGAGSALVVYGFPAGTGLGSPQLTAIANVESMLADALAAGSYA